MLQTAAVSKRLLELLKTLMANMLTVDTLQEKVIPLAEQYRVRRVDLFGSRADGLATEHSDFDFLVEFIAPVPSIFAVMGFKEELARNLASPVDVVTTPLAKPDALRIKKVVNVYLRS